MRLNQPFKASSESRRMIAGSEGSIGPVVRQFSDSSATVRGNSRVRHLQAVNLRRKPSNIWRGIPLQRCEFKPLSPCRVRVASRPETLGHHSEEATDQFPSPKKSGQSSPQSRRFDRPSLLFLNGCGYAAYHTADVRSPACAKNRHDQPHNEVTRGVALKGINRSRSIASNFGHQTIA